MATPQNPTAGPERLPSACPDFEVLSCFADGELEAGRVGTVTAHVRSCERCATPAARLSAGFRAVDVRRDGGIGGSGCADDEGLILYLTRGLYDTERAILESHLNGCDHCVATLSLLHRRLSVSDTISAPVPDAVQEAARRVLEHGSPNPTPAAVAPDGRNWRRTLERLGRLLRMPILVPNAVATGAFLVIAVQEHRSAPSMPAEQSRAIAGDEHLRVTTATAVVRGQPSGQGEVIATVRRGAALAVTGQERGWYRVMLPDKRSGWIAREAFE